MGVELRHFAWREDQILVAEDETEAAVEDVQPVVALVRARVGLAVRSAGKDLFVRLESARFAGEPNAVSANALVKVAISEAPSR